MAGDTDAVLSCMPGAFWYFPVLRQATEVGFAFSPWCR